MSTLTTAFKKLASVNILIRRNPFFYSRLSQLCRYFSDLEISEKTALVKKLLTAQLDAAGKTDYGKSLNAGVELTAWPYLEKSEVLKDPKRFMGSPWRIAIPASTSGTSGAPLKLSRSLESVVFEQVCIDSLMQAGGIDTANARIAVMRGDTIKDPNDMSPPFWRCDSQKKRLQLSAHHLSTKTIDYYVEILKSFKPDCIMAYPSSLELLAMLLETKQIELRVPLLMTSSEVLSEEARELALKTVGCKLVDHYGQAERVALAYSWGEGYYFLPLYGFIELDFIGTDNESDLYEIIATSLWHKAMPLVRYRTGDRISCQRGLRDSDLKEICQGIRAFQKIDGRQSDYLVTPDGARLIGMNQIPRGLDNVVRLQLIQDTNKQVNVLVVPREGFYSKDLDLLNRNLSEKIPKDMDVRVNVVDRVELTEQAKAPFIIRRRGLEENRRSRN